MNMIRWVVVFLFAQGAWGGEATSPQRVITLLPSLGEWVSALGLEDRLVGVSEHTDFPESLKKLPSVGPYHRGNIEAIVKLKPDLVIASTDGNSKDQILQLERLKIKTLVVNGSTLDQIFESIKVISKTLGVEIKGDELLRKFKAELIEAGGERPQKQKNIVFQIGDDPLFLVGAPSFVNDSIQLAGAFNVYDKIGKPYPQVSAEDVIKKNPDCILISSSMASSIHGKKTREKWLRFKKLKAVQENCVKLVNADLLLRSSPRLAHGVRELRTAIYEK